MATNTLIEGVLKLEEYRNALAANDANLFILFGFAATLLLAAKKLPRKKLYSIQSIIILALVVRLPQINSSFWYDETFTANLAALPYEDLGRVVMSDVHPPLWYLISSVFPQTEIGLRIPALFFGLVSIYLVYQVALNTANKRVALIAALIVALLPGHVYYSVEARQYSLLICVVLLTVLSLVKRDAALFIFSSLLGYIHAHGYLYFAIAALFALPYARKKRGWRLALGVGIVAHVVYLPIVLIQSADVSNGFWLGELTIGSILWPLPYLWAGRDVPEYLLLPVIIAIFALTLVSLRQYKNRVIVAFALGVPAMAAVISIVWHPIYLYRAFMPSAVLLVIPAAQLIAHARAWQMIAAFIIPVSLLSGLDDGGRANVRSWYAACDGYEYVYAATTHNAIMAHYYSPYPVYVWTDSNDLGQWLSEDAQNALQWSQVEQPPPGNGCLIDLHSPLSGDASRHHIAAIGKNAEIIDEGDYYYVIKYEVGS